MRSPVRLLIALLALAVPLAPAAAQHAERLVPPTAYAARDTIAVYGPFQVADARTAELVGETDSASPQLFRAMLRDFPAIRRLRFIECPGTLDDVANLALGREIRAAGLATEVPAGGSVRSGAVDLFLAGVTLLIDDSAEFAVHAWEDYDGREASDYPADSPQNLQYVAYYRDMGLRDPQGFYAMTNSVPFEQALWLDGRQMRRWIGRPGAPVLARLDLAGRVH